MSIGAGGVPGSGPIPAEDSVYQPLSLAGDGTGVIDQFIDGSSTPQLFFIQPPLTEKYTLKRLNLNATAANWNNATFYGSSNVLANGIKIYKRDDSGIIKDYTGFITIKRAHHWALLAGTDATSLGSSQADPFDVRWTFERGYSHIVLDGSNNERFVVEIQDNMTTTILSQIIMVQGYRKVIS